MKLIFKKFINNYIIFIVSDITYLSMEIVTLFIILNKTETHTHYTEMKFVNFFFVQYLIGQPTCVLTAFIAAFSLAI